MAANDRRFTISVSPGMNEELILAKEGKYRNTTQNEMLRELILKGLESLQGEHPTLSCHHEQTA